MDGLSVSDYRVVGKISKLFLTVVGINRTILTCINQRKELTVTDVRTDRP